MLFVLSSANTAIESILLAEVNPFFWTGKNGNIYDISKRFGTQRYVYNRSYRLAWERLSSSPLSKFGKVLGIGTFGIVGIDIYNNGLNASNAINGLMIVAGFVVLGDY